MKAAPRALLLSGLMNHVCINADVMRESAGCLTCESEIRRRGPYPPASFRGGPKGRTRNPDAISVLAAGFRVRAFGAPRNDCETSGALAPVHLVGALLERAGKTTERHVEHAAHQHAEHAALELVVDVE